MTLFSTIFLFIKKGFVISILLSILTLITIFYINNSSSNISYFEISYKTRHNFFTGSDEITHICPNLLENDFFESSGIENSKIAIVTPILSYKNYEDYVGIDSLKYYTNYFGYQLHLVNMTETKYETLCNHTDHFFQRHCIMAVFLEEKQDFIEYAMIIDADVGVINPCHTIQEYIDREKSVELVFYNRFYNFEIAAGNYFVRNSKYSRNFMHFWADYFYRLPKSFHGTDNGALHQVFMELHFVGNETLQMQCYPLWNKSRSYHELFAFQACTQNALNMSTTLFADNKIRLIRKLSPVWVRDGWLTGTKWSQNDFLFHGWKKSKLCGEWQWPFEWTEDINSTENCLTRDPQFSNFKYFKKYISTNEEVFKILKARKENVEKTYNNTLNELCQNSSFPLNGIC